jgi:hypothetical protein
MKFWNWILLSLFLLLYFCVGMSLAFYLHDLSYIKGRELYGYQLRRIILAWPVAAPWYWWQIKKIKNATTTA